MDVLSNNQVLQLSPNRPANYKFDPITAATPTTLANNHPTLILNGYVGGVMVTATSASTHEALYRHQCDGKPGLVGIFLPGDSSEMLAFFNVGSVDAPSNGMTSPLISSEA